MTGGDAGADRYQGIEDGPEVEHRAKGSRFLGQVFRVATADDGDRRIAALQCRYHDATHHCWAFRLPPPETCVERFNDDGEPSGTAGQPILGTLVRSEIFGALAVVTRYYGGTKLGTGGLARAYGEAARLAVDASTIRVVWRELELVLTCDYECLGAIETLIARRGEEIHGVERSFDERPVFRLRVPRSRVEGMSEALVEATAGRAQVRIGRDFGEPD